MPDLETLRRINRELEEILEILKFEPEADRQVRAGQRSRTTTRHLNTRRFRK